MKVKLASPFRRYDNCHNPYRASYVNCHSLGSANDSRETAVSSEARAKMVAGAADLISRRGVNGTSMRDLVQHTGTPRGSISHHFPRGKQQLIGEAIVFAGAQVSGPLEHLTRERGAIAGLRTFIALWRQTLEKSRFQAGCPVLAVAVEQFVNDATERDGKPDEAAQGRLLD